jgi:calcineurin-like phosphoesterase family protein
MKIFVTTDTHFGHHQLVSDFQARPEDFEIRIVYNWHRMIGQDDMVIHLGDLVVGKPVDWTSIVPTLPGRKILVIGNHDKKTISWYLKNGIDFCCSSFMWEIFGLRILFSHEPIIDGIFDLNIHGHLHSRQHRILKCDTQHYLLCLEQTSYQPRPLESLVKEWRKSNRQDSQGKNTFFKTRQR